MVHIALCGYESTHTLRDMCVRALVDAGHEVTFVSQTVNSLPLLGRLGVDDMRQRLIEECVDADPELVFVLKGYNLDEETIRSVRNRTDAVVVNWNPDNPFQVRSESRLAETHLESLSAYDIVFTWGKFLIDRLLEHGARRVEHLPFGYDPALHRPMDFVNEYACDVIFLGHWSEKRSQMLSHIAEMDVSFDLWGNYWKWKCWNRSLRGCLRGNALMGVDYARAMSSAKIVVNIVADHNVPAYNMRTFEIPATGSVMLTTDTSGQRDLFEPGEEMITYVDGDELVGRIEYYLDADEERDAIARRGRQGIKGHSYRDRMERVVAVARELDRFDA